MLDVEERIEYAAESQQFNDIDAALFSHHIAIIEFMAAAKYYDQTDQDRLDEARAKCDAARAQVCHAVSEWIMRLE